jgi:tetratricopeptide (TPR) repeat protein
MSRLVQLSALSRIDFFLFVALVFLLPWTTAQQAASSPDKVTDQRIQFFQSQLGRDPYYYVNYNRLASAYVQKARETGDISYYELAEKALAKSLELESQHSEAAETFAQLGGVQFAEHRFPEALASAQRALQLEDNPAARALAGDAQLEMGNYADAEAQFARIHPQSSNQPHPGTDYLSLSRRGALAWMRGEVAEATSLMKQAADLATQAHLPAENVAWTHFMLGEQMFQAGHLAGAQSEMNSALHAFPLYHRALAGMGQIRAAQHRDNEAADYYRRAIAIIPFPAYATALGDLYHRMGKNIEAEKQYALVEYIGQLGALNKQIYNRDLALFYADHARHLPEALALARKELELRHDVYTLDALAWALLKNGKAAEAREFSQKALALGTQDAILFFHAAAIERQLGDKDQALSYAARAIAVNPEFHVLYADQARLWLAAQGKTAVAKKGG